MCEEVCEGGAEGGEVGVWSGVVLRGGVVGGEGLGEDVFEVGGLVGHACLCWRTVETVFFQGG